MNKAKAGQDEVWEVGDDQGGGSKGEMETTVLGTTIKNVIDRQINK